MSNSDILLKELELLDWIEKDKELNAAQKFTLRILLTQFFYHLRFFLEMKGGKK